MNAHARDWQPKAYSDLSELQMEHGIPTRNQFDDMQREAKRTARRFPSEEIDGHRSARRSFVSEDRIPADDGTTYLEAMKALATATLLPRSELMHFDGHPLNYVLFTNTFDNNVEKTTDDFGKRLQLLIQFCSGRARKAIESCVLL